MASRFWVGGTGSWTTINTANWSATSGGASGASVPVAGDDVYFDGNSGTGTITLNYSPTIQHFDHTGYAGTFTSTGSVLITCTGDCIQVATATYINNGSASLRFSAGAASRHMRLQGPRMFGSGSITIDSGLTFGDFIISDNGITSSGYFSANLGGNITINGALNLNTTSFTGTFRLRSSTYGTSRTITMGASSTVSLTKVDIEFISFTGTGTPVSGTLIGDINGNSGITFPAPVTYYWIGNTGSMNTIGNYSLTSGGAAATTVPLVHDYLIFDDNSFSANGQTVTLNKNYLPDMDFTALSGSKIPILATTAPSGQANFFGRGLKLKAGMTTSGTATVWTFIGGRNSVFSQNGATITSAVSRIDTRNNGFVVTLGSDMSIPVALNTGSTPSGGFDTAGYNVTCLSASFSDTTTRTVDFRASTITLTGTGTVLNLSTGTGLTFNAGTSKVVISDTSATTKAVSQGSQILYEVTVAGGNSATISFSSNFRVTNFNCNPASATTLQFANTSNALQVSGIWNVNGSAGQLVSLVSSSPGSQFTFTVTSGDVYSRYISLQDSNATGGARFFALNSTNVSNNTGWNFAASHVIASGRIENRTYAGSIIFDGATSELSKTTPTGLNTGTDPLSFVTWGYMSSSAIATFADLKSSTLSRRFVLGYTGLCYMFSDGVNGTNSITLTDAQFGLIGLNRYVRLAWVVTTSSVSLYANGALVKTASLGVALNTAAYTTLLLGAGFSGPPRIQLLNGRQTDAYFTNSALTAAEVLADYVDATYPANMASAWAMNELTGTDVIDRIGSNNLTGSAIVWTTDAPRKSRVAPSGRVPPSLRYVPV